MISDYLIDAHCHLDLFNDIQHNVDVEDKLPIKTISVTNSPSFFEPNTKLFLKSNNIRIALGFHPELTDKINNQINLFEKYIDATKYIGEIGLDGSKDYEATYDIQIKNFKAILSIIKSSDNKILTIHSRNASKDTIDLLHSYLKNTSCKVILHWFSGSLSELNQAVKYGYFFSVNHKMATNDKGKEIISRIPQSQILTETDAPFTFDRKITNRLNSLKYTINRVSGIKCLDTSETKNFIYNNFKRLLID